MKFWPLFFLAVGLAVFGAWVVGTTDCPSEKVPVRGVIAFECVAR